MTSVILEKTFEYLRSKKVYDLKISEYYLCKEIFFFMFSSSLKDIIQAQNKTNH